MRIAQVAPLFESVPPRKYGGTERAVSYLTEELVRQGHDVTLYASGDSQTSARLVAGCPRALWQERACRETLPHHVRLVELVAREAHRFDLIHFHLDYVHIPTVKWLPCPTVTTLHGRLNASDHEALFETFAEIPLVSISNDQRRPIPWANWQATVYHGMPIDLHTFREGQGNYLAFLGRVSPEKGLEQAVEIARRSRMPLRVAAKIYPEEESYYENTIAPLLEKSPWVEFVGEVGGAAKDAFLGNARAVLFPTINWAEPFGLVMIEAMACGTPVVAFRRGSTPEGMIDGLTGLLVDDVEGAVEAVKNVPLLDRQLCRTSFVDRFGAARMARDYEAVYRRLVAGYAPVARRNRRQSEAASSRIDFLPSWAAGACCTRRIGRELLKMDGDPHHVLAPSGMADDRTRVLKHGDTFAVFDHMGHFQASGLGEEGLYHDGTRYLSCLSLELDDGPPFFLGSTVRDENDQLSVTLTNPDRVRDGRVVVPLGALYLGVRTLLWEGACHWRLRVTNHGTMPVHGSIQIRFRADFADIFEVRGMKRPARGRDLPVELAPGRAVLGYVGLDGDRRRSLIRFTPAPVVLAVDRARFDLSIPGPHEEMVFDLAVA